MRMLATALAFGAALALGVNARAQTSEAAPQAVHPILLIDAERLFSESLFGQRVVAELGRESEALAAENRSIEAELRAEEQDLTKRRPSMSVEAFRAEAEAFDAKVQSIREAQDAKERALQQGLAAGREALLQNAQPILGQVMETHGASMILDSRTVFLGTSQADITDVAIRAVDEKLGADAKVQGDE